MKVSDPPFSNNEPGPTIIVGSYCKWSLSNQKTVGNFSVFFFFFFFFFWRQGNLSVLIVSKDLRLKTLVQHILICLFPLCITPTFLNHRFVNAEDYKWIESVAAGPRKTWKSIWFTCNSKLREYLMNFTKSLITQHRSLKWRLQNDINLVWVCKCKIIQHF